ncbi:pimeloyl-ACP methyl ester carboxylesterase [Aminobacter aminovorans]|uniref:Dihydrolipoyllysine-residue acetyltransferase component of acetoin cleaving system n=1 Tax=Aminobacter aminovorans TaxID=83263 RepID=A0A380WJU7_AMIAI|nr:alpha/beta hydrolase [Aminobacter aminovorans]TCS29172.1 pimeloyl-ACP methyl ester carboxylesterase [Aminobacter aminovorans]SUU89025.1 Dihydrolipoyllysine-residue acetyltransferase component of acetoin cleaving system [Aminobacter aminovorans]
MKPLSIAGAALLALFSAIAPAVLSAQEPAPLELHRQIHGQGPPLVLLHGAFMTIENNWATSLGELAKYNKVIAVELQGHGRTADRTGELAYETMADDVAGLLDKLGIEKASVMGYSMGGNVALQMALRHPGRVDRIVAVSAAASDKGLAPGHKEMVQRLRADMFTGAPMVAEYQKLSPKPDFPALVDKIKQLELKPFDWTAELAKVKAPVLLVAGDADVVTLGHLADMHVALGGHANGDVNGPSRSQLLVLSGTTHMGILADPAKAQQVAAAANAFLNAPAPK